jgi:hypothetical protein
MKRRIVNALMGLALLGGIVTAGVSVGPTSSAHAAAVGECGELLWATMYHIEQGNWGYVNTLKGWWDAAGCSF